MTSKKCCEINNGSWEKIYSEQGEVQHEILVKMTNVVLISVRKYTDFKGDDREQFLKNAF